MNQSVQVLSLKSSQDSWTSSWEGKLVPFDTGLREAKGGALAGARDAAGLGPTRASEVSQQTSDNVHGPLQCLELSTSF